ncbi:chromo domain-containing protein 1 [Podospora fimiseda]|uniref:Chromo domain-containing protein 1 n=1 Tax=Podospora fimiseda TaxID=252190 RepID=A0AAN7BSR3_9PEZI|nr:chromo domain-containing protein 1 [Podospora fimiseda]
MFPRRAAPAADRNSMDDDPAETDDDTISLTDTDLGDPDQEWAVEHIIGERYLNGQLYLLVEWSDFDKLRESTWELASQLGDALNEEWQTTKARLEANPEELEETKKFIKLREEVHTQLALERKSRHRRRNAKRKRLGIPLVDYPDLSESEDHAAVVDEDSSYDEAVEDPVVIDGQPAERSNATTPRQSPQQRMFKGIPKGNSSSPTKETAKGQPKEKSDSRRSSVTNKVTKVQAPADNRGTSASSLSAPKKTPASQPSTTGYSGTARKLSRDQADSLPKSKAQGSIAAPKASSSSSSAVAKSTGGITKLHAQLKAKKSAVHATGNIFTSGKTRKPRTSLSNAMADGQKPQSLFNKARFLRKAMLAGRAKEDLAPDPSKVPLFLAKEGPAAARRVSKDSLQGPLDLVQSPQSISSAGDPRRSSSIDLNPLATAGQEPKGKQNAEQQPRPLKKKKSVRFAGLDDDQGLFVDEPDKMDIDSSSRAAESPTSRRGSTSTALPGLTVLKKSSLPVGNFSSPKTMILGQSRPVHVLFNGLPDTPTARDGLLAHFLEIKELEFPYTCLVQTAVEKIKSMIARPLATGYITPKDGSPALEVAAKYLRTRSIGLYCVQSYCHILVYPTRCEEWDSIKFLGQGETEGAGQSDAHLRYYVFDANLDLTPLLVPMSSAPAIAPTDKELEGAVDQAAAADGLVANRTVMMKRLFNFDYQQLLPPSKHLKAHIFFLAIPEARQEALMTLCQWLRSCNPASQIFCSDQPGSWAAFHSTVESLQTPGVVIIHEILAWSLSRFPNLALYLTSHQDEYWCMAEPIYRFPIYPSMPLVEDPAPPGDFQMTRIFPRRTAILLTPSFLVSEPRRTADFFEWFLTNKAKSFDCRLVTAFNIHEYLYELAEEKQEARNELKRSVKKDFLHFEENLQGLSRADCIDRFHAAVQAAELHYQRERKFGGLYDRCSLVYVDQSIDPNDEQSLVNWFGWWTNLKADQFRNFYVVGSNDSIKRQGSKKGERRMKVPRYSKITINDPDAVMEVFQEQNDQAAQLDQHPPHVGEMENNRVETPIGPRRRESWSARSRILPNERGEMFSKELVRIEKRCKSRWSKANEWVLYRFPVSWISTDMADHYHDPHMHFNRIKDWHGFAFEFNNSYLCHTYMGYFYTANDEFDIYNPPSDREPERHPWLAVWRQLNANIRPWGPGREIIIWDPTVKSRVGDGRQVTDNDLTFMQRQVVEYLLDHVAVNRKDAFVDKVWLGGFQLPEECDSDLPIDLVFQFIEACVSTRSAFLRLLPAKKELMSKAGFKLIHLPEHSTRAGSTSRHTDMSAGSESMIFDSSDHEDSSEDEDTRMIFHPPRGSGSGSIRSKCTNRLYEAARLARANQGRHVTHMDYAFRPTSDWYTEQRAEGRDYSHIIVEPWDTVFNKLKVRRPEFSSNRDKASTATPI